MANTRKRDTVTCSRVSFIVVLSEQHLEVQDSFRVHWASFSKFQQLDRCSLPSRFLYSEVCAARWWSCLPSRFLCSVKCVQIDDGPHTECLLLILDHRFLLLGFQSHLSALLAFGWHFSKGFCDAHLQHYVKINPSVLFKYLQAFVALWAIFKVTFKTIRKEDNSTRESLTLSGLLH